MVSRCRNAGHCWAAAGLLAARPSLTVGSITQWRVGIAMFNMSGLSSLITALKSCLLLKNEDGEVTKGNIRFLDEEITNSNPSEIVKSGLFHFSKYEISLCTNCAFDCDIIKLNMKNYKIRYLHCRNSMVLILDGNSEIGAHVKKTYFPSYARKIT